MENIGKNIDTLIQQIDSIDGKSTHFSINDAQYTERSSFVQKTLYYSQKFFFHWSVFLFLIVVIILYKPTNVYRVNPQTGKREFVWSSFFITLGVWYSFILGMFYLHMFLVVR